MTLETVLRILVVGGSALGVSLCLWWSMHMAHALGRATLQRLAIAPTYRRGVIERLTATRGKSAIPATMPSAPTTEEERLGLAPVPWLYWRLTSMAVGLVLAGAIVWGTPAFPLVALGTLAYFVPDIIRRHRIRQARWQQRLTLRDFMVGLRLALTLNVTISRALESALERYRGTPLGNALMRHRNELALTNPERALDAVAREMQVSDLHDLLTRLRAAQRGGLSFAEALATSVQQVSQGIALDAEYEVEAAPGELLLPMLVFLFPPLLILALLPVLDTLMRALTIGR